MLSPKSFYEEYVWDHRPVVFREAVKELPALSKWSKDDYLKKQYVEYTSDSSCFHEALYFGRMSYSAVCILCGLGYRG